MALLIPPFRFATIEEGLYRGAYPTLKNFRFLKRLSLKTIVSLTPEPTTPDLLSFCQANEIQHHHLRVPKYDETVRVTQAMISQVIQLMLGTDNLPLFIHCLDGLNVTGLFVMCLRKLQNWSPTCISNEFARFSYDDEVSPDEAEFLEQFRHEIIIPESIPLFLWGGQKISKHPTMKIKYVTHSSPESRAVKSTRDLKEKGIKMDHDQRLRQKNIYGIVSLSPDSDVARKIALANSLEPLALEGIDYMLRTRK